MKILLYHPQIPQNTGNIVRTCSVTGCDLILVKPLGFSTSDKKLKRAGLDYWDEVKISEIDDMMTYLESAPSFYCFSSHADKLYTDVEYTENSVLVFGSETSGLPREVHEKYPDKMVKLPMLDKKRCLNLATSAGIALYEAIRQTKLLG